MKLTQFPLMLALVSAVTAISGCTGQHVAYGEQCMTCIDNPITGEPMNYDPTEYSTAVAGRNTTSTAARSVPHTLEREQIVLRFPSDVDTTGQRLKKTFGYMTREEAVAEMGNAGKTMFAGPGYAYQATPGAFYYMKTQAYSGDLSTQVTREGSGATVKITYEQKRSGGKDFQSVMREVRDRAEKALQ